MAPLYRALVVDDQGVLRDGLGPVPPDGVASLVRRARARGLLTAVLSNADRVDPALTGLVDVVLVSGGTGLAKPSPAAFRACAQRLGLEPQQCLFVDDLPANVRGAAAAGMTGVLHRSVEQTTQELDVLLGI